MRRRYGDDADVGNRSASQASGRWEVSISAVKQQGALTFHPLVAEEEICYNELAGGHGIPNRKLTAANTKRWCSKRSLRPVSPGCHTGGASSSGFGLLGQASTGTGHKDAPAVT
jgi:hypothetical protein